MVPAVIPAKTLATFIFIWNGLADSARERKITGKSGQKSPKFNSKLLKDVQKIEKHFEDAEIEITEIQVCKSKDSKHA